MSVKSKYFFERKVRYAFACLHFVCSYNESIDTSLAHKILYKKTHKKPTTPPSPLEKPQKNQLTLTE